MLKGLVKDVIIYGIAGGLSKSLMILLLPIFTRYFTPEEYGIVDIVTSVLMFLSIMSMLQMESAIGRYFYEVEDEKENRINISTAFWTVIMSTTVIVVLLLSVNTSLSSTLFGSEDYGELFVVAAAILPASNIYAFLTSVMRYVKKPILYGLFSLIQITLTLGSSIAYVVVMDVGVVGVFYGQLTGFGVAALVMFLYCLHTGIIGMFWKKKVVVRYFQFSLPIVPGMVASWANIYLNRFIMLSYLSLAEIGFFTVAFRIACLFRILEDAGKMAWGPFLYQSLEQENHKEVIKTVFNFAVTGVFTLVIILALFSNELFHLFASEEYDEGIYILPILFLALAINSLVQIVLIGPVITKKTHYNSIIIFVSLAVNIGLLLILVPKYGLSGVPISLLCSSFTLFILSWIITEKLYYIGYSKPAFLITFVSALGAVGLSVFFDLELMIRILIAILAGVAMYAMSLFYFKTIKQKFDL